MLPNIRDSNSCKIRNDYIKHYRTLRYSYKSYIYRVLTRSEYINISIRNKCTTYFNYKYFAKSNITCRQVCRITGRSHFVLKFAGLSRLIFKQIAGAGLLCGVARYGK
jgi:ribosomal protein S14